MKTSTLTINNGYRDIFVHCSESYSQFATDFVMDDLQKFLDYVPNVNPNEPFYFGFWRVMVKERNGELSLWEWDFGQKKFIPELGKSIRLWHEQATVCASQSLSWTSICLEHLIYYTPSVFDHPSKSIVEGIRDKKNAPKESGWFLYTEDDRVANKPFLHAPLHKLLCQYNVFILRFLGLPDGWSFNINQDGISHIWEERLTSAP